MTGQFVKRFGMRGVGCVCTSRYVVCCGVVEYEVGNMTHGICGGGVSIVDSEREVKM